jgi:hypothetical protein
MAGPNSLLNALASKAGSAVDIGEMFQGASTSLQRSLSNFSGGVKDFIGLQDKFDSQERQDVIDERTATRETERVADRATAKADKKRREYTESKLLGLRGLKGGERSSFLKGLGADEGVDASVLSRGISNDLSEQKTRQDIATYDQGQRDKGAVQMIDALGQSDASLLGGNPGAEGNVHDYTTRLRSQANANQSLQDQIDAGAISQLTVDNAIQQSANRFETNANIEGGEAGYQIGQLETAYEVQEQNLKEKHDREQQLSEAGSQFGLDVLALRGKTGSAQEERDAMRQVTEDFADIAGGGNSVSEVRGILAEEGLQVNAAELKHFLGLGQTYNLYGGDTGSEFSASKIRQLAQEYKEMIKSPSAEAYLNKNLKFEEDARKRKSTQTQALKEIRSDATSRQIRNAYNKNVGR